MKFETTEAQKELSQRQSIGQIDIMVLRYNVCCMPHPPGDALFSL
jgi:hypothetical protein